MSLQFHPYDPAFVAAVRAGGPDANGQPAEHAVSDGSGNPCRSCLQMIPEGAPMLILAACPFPERQPYAETGPIFLCAKDCTPWAGSGLPPCVAGGEDRLLKGYTADHRILYGTGTLAAPDAIAATCETLLSNAKVAFVDVRSSRNNCFTFRVTRDRPAELRRHS